MRHPLPCALLAGSVILLSACGGSKPAAVSRAIDTVNAVDQRNVAELMLKAGNPDEAVRYFNGQLEDDPDNLRNRRGLARSLIRAAWPTRSPNGAPSPTTPKPRAMTA